MTTSAETVRRILTSPATVGTYVLLVVPFGVGWVETRLFSPLALPGYLLFTIGTAIGNALAPRFELWLYLGPFLVGCFGIAAVVGAGYERWRGRRSRASANGDAVDP